MKINALAHRGHPRKYPENTITAYQAAYDLGFTYIELDVQLSKDGVPIIMHDITVDRTTNGSGFVKDFTYDELRKLKVGEYEKIPTLEEALLFAKGKLKVAVELKQMGDLHEGLEKSVLEVIEKTGMLDQVYVNSFDHFSIERLRDLSEEIDLGLIIHGATPSIVPYMKELKAKYLSVRLEYLTDEFVNLCEQEGIKIVVWPVDYDWQFDIIRKYPQVLSTTNELESFKEFYMEYYQ